MSKSVYSVGAFLAGAIVGGVAVLLLTPKTGSELRSEISDFAEEEVQKVKNAASRLRKEAKENQEAE